MKESNKIKPVGILRKKVVYNKEEDKAIPREVDWESNGSGIDGRKSWEDKSTEEKMDIIAKSAYQMNLEENFFPFSAPKNKPLESYSEKQKADALKAAKKAVRNNLAFMSGYKGEYYYYKPYNIVFNFCGRIFSPIRKKLRKIKTYIRDVRKKRDTEKVIKGKSCGNLVCDGKWKESDDMIIK